MKKCLSMAGILAGSVNIEQTAALDFNHLEYLLEQECITTKRHQHTALLAIANEQNVNKIFMQNAQLLNLKKCKYFYFDPHSISYEGMLDILTRKRHLFLWIQTAQHPTEKT